MNVSTKLRILTAAQLAEEQRNGTLVLDTRAPEEFASLHIRGAIQIGLVGPFSSWAAIVLKPAQKLVLVAENEDSAEEAHVRLARVGLSEVAGYSLADEAEWRDARITLLTISTYRCATACQAFKHRSVQLVDVRSRAEWLKGHLPGAISVPLLDLESRAELIDPSRPSLVYCREGFRATTAASILLRRTSGEIGILIDGVEGWLASGRPLEVPDTSE